MTVASVYTFGTSVELLGALALWLVIFLRAPSALRSRQARMLLLSVVGIAGSITVYLDPVTAVLNRNFVFAQSCGLAMNLWGVLSAALILDFVLAAIAHRRPWLVYGLMVATSAVLVTLNATSDPYAGCVSSIFVPWYSPYWWLLIAAHLVAVIPCAILCGQHGYRAREDRSLRTGLFILASGFASSAVFWTVVLGYLLFRPKWLGALFPLNIGVTAWLMTAGTALPLALELRNLARNMSELWRLWPLWRDLVEATPQVALDMPRRRWRDLAGGERAVYLRLYRRVIEIRDAMLILQDYVDAETLTRARQHVSERGGDEAAVTACWLEAARRAKLGGGQPSATPAEFSAWPGDDLRAEIGFLLKVAQARTTSAVASFLADDAGPAPQTVPTETGSA